MGAGQVNLAAAAAAVAQPVRDYRNHKLEVS